MYNAVLGGLVDKVSNLEPGFYAVDGQTIRIRYATRDDGTRYKLMELDLS